MRKRATSKAIFKEVKETLENENNEVDLDAVYEVLPEL